MFPDALILAGGMGTRLQSALPETPKVLAPVNGKPFIRYLLDQLRDAGARRTIISTGFRAEQVRDELGDRYEGMALVYSQEESPLGTGGALRHALPLLQPGLVLAMNGDSFTNADLRAYHEWHCARTRQASVLLAEVEDAARYGTVQADEHDNVTSFREKEGQQKPGWINAGIYLFPRTWIEEMPATAPRSLEREVLPQWTQKGLGAYRAAAEFIDIGTPETWEGAGLFFERLGASRSLKNSQSTGGMSTGS